MKWPWRKKPPRRPWIYYGGNIHAMPQALLDKRERFANKLRKLDYNVFNPAAYEDAKNASEELVHLYFERDLRLIRNRPKRKHGDFILMELYKESAGTSIEMFEATEHLDLEVYIINLTRRKRVNPVLTKYGKIIGTSHKQAYEFLERLRGDQPE